MITDLAGLLRLERPPRRRQRWQACAGRALHVDERPGAKPAALLEHPARFKGKRVGLPVSGGNIDSRVLASVLMRGLVRDARLVRLRVTMPDVSGSLAKVATLIAEAGGNIVEIQHQRIFGTASVRSPEVEFLIETRDREHTQALVRSLEAKGISVAVF